MPGKIRFVTTHLTMTATLDDSPGASELMSRLPADAIGQALGASFYFMIDVPVPEDGAVEEVESGTVAYWLATSSLVIFYGERPTTPVVPLGRLDGNPGDWRKVISGTEIRVEKV